MTNAKNIRYIIIWLSSHWEHKLEQVEVNNKPKKEKSKRKISPNILGL